MLAMNPTPQESFSSEGSYRPTAGGRNVCSTMASARSAGFESAKDCPSNCPGATMVSRSLSDLFIVQVLSTDQPSAAHLGRLRNPPTGPPLVLREPQFLKFGWASR